MKAYMGYSRSCGPEEGACLVFADSVQQAKTLTWNSIIGDLCEDYLDAAAKLLRNEPWLFKEAKKFSPHVIESPKTCTHCDLWGQSEIGDDGLCEGCREMVHEQVRLPVSRRI